ncbi:MAG: hypothetical protein KFF73_09170 [Cyclobacteriaceae bacterium]|nr:hypothetical protein [Cyclobacteriaceae bacterium]
MKTIKILTNCLFIFAMSFTLINCGNDEEEPKGNFIKITSITPQSPASLNFNDYVNISYEYNIVDPDGARMWIIPQTGGANSPGYLYSSSGIFNGAGTRQVVISISDEDDPVIVDQLRVTMKNPDQSEELYEELIAVEYTFGN